MATKTERANDTLQPKERAYIENVVAHPELSKYQCAIDAGWKQGSYSKMANRPRVVKALEEALQKKTEAVQAIVREQREKTMAELEAQNATPEYIIGRLKQIADDGPDKAGTFGSQVNALKELAKLGGLYPEEAEYREGIKQDGRGGIEIYRAKWLKGGDSERVAAGD